MKNKFSIIGIFLLSGLFFGASPGPGNQVQQQPLVPNLVVTKTADTWDGTCDADCSLRDAVLASGFSQPDVIGFAPCPTPPCVYQLTIAGDDNTGKKGDLDITDPKGLTILGNGKDVTVIEVADTVNDRAFHIIAGNVTFSGLTIRKGRSGTNGGGIFHDGISHLTVKNCAILNNEAGGEGGGIHGGYYDSRLTVTGTEISGNTAKGGAGGGIYHSGVAVYLSGNTVSGNKASTDGGGINSANNDAKLTVVNSTVSGNEAQGGQGGGIYGEVKEIVITKSVIDGNKTSSHGGGLSDPLYPSKLTVTDSTVSGNEAQGGEGGGIYGAGTEIAVTGSTLSGNKASTDGGGFSAPAGSKLDVTNSTFAGNTAAKGGAISQAGGTSALLNVTFSGNSAADGGAVYNYGGAMTIKNSLFKSGVSGGNCGGVAMTSSGHNLEDLDTCGFKEAGDLANKKIDLEPLDDNGNPAKTKTLALKPGSPAIDAGDNTGAPTKDQRGVARPQPVGGNVDIGAYEASPKAFLLAGSEALSFPDTVVGAKSAEQILTITNAGNADLTVGAVGLNKSPDFEITKDECFNKTLSPKGNCVLSLVFSPSAFQSVTAFLEILSNGGDKVVSLTGTGIFKDGNDGLGGGSGSGSSTGTGSGGGSDTGTGTGTGSGIGGGSDTGTGGTGGGSIPGTDEKGTSETGKTDTGSTGASTGAGGCGCRLH